MRSWTILCACCALFVTSRGIAQSLPSDVRTNHWASSAISSVLTNKVMRLPDGKQFRGDAKVTRTEAIIAIANLAHALEAQQWKTKPSIGLAKRADILADQMDWKTQPVTRFALARILARAGDYFMNGVRRGAQNSKDRGKSVKLPPRANVKLPSTHPAFASLTYLASKNGLWNNSPLLTPDEKSVTGQEVSKALAQMLLGLNDAVTDMGKEPDGSTPDRPIQKKKG